jgi:hypothetical protein
MPVAMVNSRCSAISLPWSQVTERASSVGNVLIRLVIARRTSSAVPSASLSSMTKRVFRSTRVPMQLLFLDPTMRSPSQWPGTARSSTSGGRSEMSTISGIRLLRRTALRALGLRIARPLRRAWWSSVRRAPRPCT